MIHYCCSSDNQLRHSDPICLGSYRRAGPARSEEEQEQECETEGAQDVESSLQLQNPNQGE